MTNGVSKSELFFLGWPACGVFYDVIREGFTSIHSFTFVFGQQTFFSTMIDMACGWAIHVC